MVSDILRSSRGQQLHETDLIAVGLVIHLQRKKRKPEQGCYLGTKGAVGYFSGGGGKVIIRFLI